LLEHLEADGVRALVVELPATTRTLGRPARP